MKRDPRLRRLGERRGERRLHGPRFTSGYRLAQRIAATFGLAFTRGHFVRTARAAQAQYEAHERFVAQLKRTAAIVSGDLTEQLRRDGALYGEARVHCDWDDVLNEPTVERVPPQDWGRWPHVPLTDAQAALLDEGWGPSPSELA